MKQAQPIVTSARVEAYIASALRLLWRPLGAVLRFGLTGRSAKLKQTLCLAERGVESTLFLKAIALYGPAARRRGRRGDRRLKYRRLALFFKGARVRARKASALTRVLALIDALLNPERAVSYFLKRICKGLRYTKLVALPSATEAPSCAALVAQILAPDTS
ncbi:MAG: hypothetical protein AB7H66_17500 [Hyphomonadaceae bacterium]